MKIIYQQGQINFKGNLKENGIIVVPGQNLYHECTHDINRTEETLILDSIRFNF